LNVNITKLNQYININLYIKNYNYESEEKNRFKSPYVKCTPNDFEINGINLEEYGMESVEVDKRLCPNFDEVYDFLNIREHYSNKKERSSFRFEILKCEHDCKSDQEIDNLLK